MRSRRRTRWFTASAIVCLTLLAPLLGGTTTLWAQAIIALCTGLLFLVSPPQRSIGLTPNAALITFGLLSLTAFLPAAWAGLPPWRTALVGLGAELPATRTPQPWLSFEAIALLFLGLAWTYYVFAKQFSLRTRTRMWAAYCVGILTLAAAMTFCLAFGKRIPFWPDVEHFGFFPNRNQTSNVLALGGIMIYATGLQQLQDRRPGWWLWLYSLALVFWALIVNYSRSGIILLFLGAVVWHALWIYGSRERRQPAMALAGLLILAAIFTAVGGATLQRFTQATQDALASGPSRLAIQHDALLMSGSAPALGAGLGNFGPLFSMAKRYYDLPKSVIHPESDVLWVAVEMGWVAVILLIVLFIWWIRQCFPFTPGTERRLRMAAVISVCAFALHAFFDVSGHRIGSAWPALFLAGTAVHPERTFVVSSWVPRVFRFAGLLLIALSAWWFASIFGMERFPTSAQRYRLDEQLGTAITNQAFPLALDLASKNLRIAPLDWSAYHSRATAEAAQHLRSQAKQDFAIARYLLPFWPDSWLKQGAAWAIGGDIDDAFATWTAMIRQFPENAPGLYREIYQFVQGDPDLVDRWRILGRENRECLLIFFRSASPAEFQIELNRLLAQDPELKVFDASEKTLVFRAWYDRGDKLDLAEALRTHPDWERIAWQELAHILAEYGDYGAACEIVQKYAQLPTIPDLARDASVANLEMQVRLYPNEVDTAAALCVALAKAGRIDESLLRIEATRRRAGSPSYLAVLEAQLWAGKGDWRKAWSALARFAEW
jgi:O-antigen ligase